MNNLIYTLPDGMGTLMISSGALESMLPYRQKGIISPEAGGQLFASFEDTTVFVIEATGPRKKDKRSRFRFWPHRPSEQAEITERYKKKGLHYIGDWHTHPQTTPIPSGSDAASVADIFASSKHDLFGVLLVILGTGDLPAGLYVGLQDKDGLRELSIVDGQVISTQN